MPDLVIFVLYFVVFAAFFGLVVGVVLIALLGGQLATEERGTGRHQPGRLRSARRRAESTWRTGRRAAARVRRRLAETPSPVPVTAAPLVHGLAGVQ